MSTIKDFFSRLIGKSQTGNKSQPSGICNETVLQYTKPGRDGECELIIGLDFGTSASKVVIQVPDLPGRPSYVVDFGDFAHPSMACLLPSKLWVGPGKSCHLLGQADSIEVGDIKLELFSNSELSTSNNGPSRHGYVAEHVAVAYLSLLLRYARMWFLESKQSLVGRFSKLIWAVNLGVPSPCVEENEENCRFRRIGKAAWMLSAVHSDVTLEKAAKELSLLAECPDNWKGDSDGITCDFDIIPEIAAGAVGYALSDLRREGAHVMIDVGASTLDVCSFLLRQSDQNRYSLLTADVKQLGTIRLHHTRIQAIQHAFEVQAQKLRDKHDPLAPISEDIDSYLLPEIQIRAEVSQAEELLRKNCQMVIRKVIHDLRRRRAPNEDVWLKKLPILLIGGGSKLPYFRSIVEELDAWTQQYYGNEGIILQEVPVPETLKINTDEYHRLAVAWGLSHRALDIGEIIASDRIDDIDPPARRKWENNYISKDQV